MLYWRLIPRFGQKFSTLSDSSKEWIFSPFPIWNDGPLKRLIKAKHNVVSWIIQSWITTFSQIRFFVCVYWKSQYFNPFLLVSVAWLCPFLPSEGWLKLTFSKLARPKSSHHPTACYLGGVWLRNTTFNFPPLEPNPANTHGLKVVCVSAPYWEVTPVMVLFRVNVAKTFYQSTFNWFYSCLPSRETELPFTMALFLPTGLRLSKAHIHVGKMGVVIPYSLI